MQRREFAEPIKRSIQVRISSSCNDDDGKSKAVSKELKRLSTFNSLVILEHLHPALLTCVVWQSGPLWSGSVAPEVSAYDQDSAIKSLCVCLGAGCLSADIRVNTWTILVPRPAAWQCHQRGSVAGGDQA